MSRMLMETSVDFCRDLYSPCQGYGGSLKEVTKPYPTIARVTNKYIMDGNIIKTITYNLYVGMMNDNSMAEVMIQGYRECDLVKEKITLQPEDIVFNTVEEFLEAVESIYVNGNSIVFGSSENKGTTPKNLVNLTMDGNNISFDLTENKGTTPKRIVNLTMDGNSVDVNTLNNKNTNGLLTASIGVPYVTASSGYKLTSLEFGMRIGAHIGYALNKNDKLVLTGDGLVTVNPGILIFGSIEEMKEFIKKLEMMEISYSYMTLAQVRGMLRVRHY